MHPPIAISPETEATLRSLSVRTGRSVAELLAAAVEAYRDHECGPIAEIPGVDPAHVWEAAAEADAGRLTDHQTVFDRLRGK